MRLSGLQPLYRSMRDQGLERTKFRYRHNHLIFECLFFIDIQPFELVMGCLGRNFAISIEVRKGFEITPYIEPRETFIALCNALFQGAGSSKKFDPVSFFTEFNHHIPKIVTPDQIPTPDEIVRWYPDIDKADKRFFCGWLDNTKQRKHVSLENLEKTHRLLGRRAYDLALRRNLSTRWTYKQSKALAFFLPD